MIGGIGVDLGGAARARAHPIIEKRPCIYHFLPLFAPQYYGLPTQYIWQVYAIAETCHKHVSGP